MKILSIITTVLFFAQSAIAQKTFGVKLNGGSSIVYTQVQIYSGGYDIPEYFFRPSGNAGLFYNKQINSFHWGMELLFVQLEGREHVTGTIPDIYPFVDYVHDYDRHISYLGFPVYCGFKIKKMIFSMGPQIYFKLIHNTDHKSQWIYDNGDIIVRNNDYDCLEIGNINIGLRGGIIFNLTDRFDIEGNYNLIGIPYDKNKVESSGIDHWYAQQITIGVRYTFFTIKKKKNIE